MHFVIKLHLHFLKVKWVDLLHSKFHSNWSYPRLQWPHMFILHTYADLEFLVSEETEVYRYPFKNRIWEVNWWACFLILLLLVK